MSRLQSPLVAISGLTIDFDIGKRHVRALHGIDLSVARGETLGVVGESGCGKSITWMAALGLLGPRAKLGGSVLIDGCEMVGASESTMTGIRGKRAAMIFQDPSSSLNPVHRIGRQLGESLRLHRGMSGQAAGNEARRLLERVGIANAAQRLNEYPHELSGGMNQRVMIAMALAGQPDILIADEPTTALDATIQAQILDLLRDLRGEHGMALVLISHDLGVVAEMADRVAVMYCGRVIEEGPAETLFAEPIHPYTRGLIAALPDLQGPKRRLAAIPGTVPPPDRLPVGCTFADRCLYAEPFCTDGVPALRALSDPRHRAACVRAERVVGAAPAEARAIAGADKVVEFS